MRLNRALEALLQRSIWLSGGAAATMARADEVIYALPAMNIPVNQYSLVIDSPLGRLGMLVVDQQVQRLDYLDAAMPLRAARGPFERKLLLQLEKYFHNPRAGFSVAFSLAGTPFQQRVWQALTRIPSGDTLTYGELAARLGTGARAVGNACRRNPVSIIVPCHRVVAAGGIGGYSGSVNGARVARKRWLLAHEGRPVAALKNPALAPHSRTHQIIKGDLPV